MKWKKSCCKGNICSTFLKSSLATQTFKGTCSALNETGQKSSLITWSHCFDLLSVDRMFQLNFILLFQTRDSNPTYIGSFGKVDKHYNRLFHANVGRVYSFSPMSCCSMMLFSTNSGFGFLWYHPISVWTSVSTTSDYFDNNIPVTVVKLY